MFRRIPSLTALRALEAAARLKSFKAAADELGVTPTAVSHRVRAIEEALGVALFVRQVRAIELTEEGAILASAVHSGFLEIKNAIEELKVFENTLTVTTTPAFAALRVVPRLGEFTELYPDVRVQLSTGTTVVDLQRDRHTDIAIRYGTGSYPGFHKVPLVQETFGAYCAPDYLTKVGSPASGVLLETGWQQQVLMHINWANWFSRSGEDTVDEKLNISRYDEEIFVLQAAIGGQGMALASSVLARDLVDRKLLVHYKPDIHLEGASYTAICLTDRAQTAKIKNFLNWLQAVLKD